jgi:hypothetical protein
MQHLFPVVRHVHGAPEIMTDETNLLRIHSRKVRLCPVDGSDFVREVARGLVGSEREARKYISGAGVVRRNAETLQLVVPFIKRFRAGPTYATLLPPRRMQIPLVKEPPSEGNEKGPNDSGQK